MTEKFGYVKDYPKNFLVNILAFSMYDLRLIISFNKSESVWVNCTCCCWVSASELAVCFGRGWFRLLYSFLYRVVLSCKQLYSFFHGEAEFSVSVQIREVKKNGPPVSSTFSSHHFKGIPLLGPCAYYLAAFEEEQPISFHPSWDVKLSAFTTWGDFSQTVAVCSASHPKTQNYSLQ